MKTNKTRFILIMFVLGVLSLACALVDGTLTATTSPSPTVVPTTAAPTAAAPATETVAPPPSPTAADHLPSPSPPTGNSPSWPQPAPTEAPLSRTKPTAAQQATAVDLYRNEPPERDDVALAAAYYGANELPAPAPLVTEPLAPGTQQTLKISNIEDNTVAEIDAELMAVGEHAYFWFDTGPGTATPDADLLAEMADEFDEIYETVTFYFGSESNPGVDGDPRLHIVHASPLVLCNVTLETADQCGLAGYFSARNLFPTEVNPNSNVREMFVMNIHQFGTPFYLNVLAHEFRHMVEDNYDKGDWDWEVEGSAVLAEDLWGAPQSGQQRGNGFLQNPDQQLNRWTDGNTTPYYGQGYLFNRYLYDQLGIDLYREFAASPLPGLRALDEIAAANDLVGDGHALWLDWQTALAVHDAPGVAKRFDFAPELTLSTAALETLTAATGERETTVHQYAADYYQLDGDVTVKFVGSTLAPLLDALPPSGQFMWYAQRANYSNPRLTRRVDLRGVDAATLHYTAYVDIEQGYDFAYVAVSTDNGRSWQGLSTKQMQGASPADDPAGVAYTERFYTGRRQTWLQETADLTPYAGQEILLRFEYVTDPILTYGGLALDNIAIPEIGFYDDAETLVDGWTTAGFTRASAYLPQSWHVRLIRFDAGRPVVEDVALASDQRGTVAVERVAGQKRPILIIAASAPRTLEQAYYHLDVGQ